MISKIQNNNYKVTVLTEEEKQNLVDTYGMNVAASDGIIPVVYGVFNKETEVYEHYCANLPQATAVLTMLTEGLQEEIDKLPKEKPDLRSV